GSEVYRVRQDLSQDQQIEGLPLGTVGGVLVRHAFPLDAEYQFQVKLFRSNIESIRGLESTTQLEILVDGVRVHLATLGGDTDFALAVDNPTVGGDVVDARMQVRMPVKRASVRSVWTSSRSAAKALVGCSRLFAARPTRSIRPDDLMSKDSQSKAPSTHPDREIPPRGRYSA